MHCGWGLLNVCFFIYSDGIAAKLLRNNAGRPEGRQKRSTVVQDQHEAGQTVL